MNLDTASLIAGLSDFLKSGIAVTVTLAPSGATIAPVEPLNLSGVLKEGTDDLIKVTSQRGHNLRTYNPKYLSKSGAKIAEAMRICASEGWHLWEMQFACYCHEFGFSPEYGNRPSNLAEFEPLNYKNFGFVREAFLNYSKCKRSSLIAKLKAI
jgi:hypothetical protein